MSLFIIWLDIILNSLSMFVKTKKLLSKQNQKIKSKKKKKIIKFFLIILLIYKTKKLFS